MVSNSAQIDFNSVPMSGFNEPKFCGKCGKNTDGKTCTKCNVEPSEFLKGDKRTHLASYLAIIFLLLIIPIGYIAIAPQLHYNTYTPSIGVIAATLPVFGIMAYYLWKKQKHIKDYGFINCPYCHKSVSPKSTWCIYCGKPVGSIY